MKIDSAPPSVLSPEASPAREQPARASGPAASPLPSALSAPAAAAGDRAPALERVDGTPDGEPVRTKPLVPFSPGTRRAVLLGLALGLAVLALRMAGILTPFLWAIVVAYAFNPLIRAVQRRSRLPRIAIVALLYLTVLGGLGAVLTGAVPLLNQQTTQLAHELPLIVQNLGDRYFGTHAQQPQIAGYTIDVPSIARSLANSLNTALNSFFGGTFAVVTGTVTRLAEFLLFLIVTFYLLLDAPQIGASLARAIPQRHRAEVLDVAGRVDYCLSQYLRAQLVLIAIMGTVAFLVLSIMGVRFAVVLAPMVGILEIFPIIGPFAAITLVTLVALFSPPHYGLSNTSSGLIVALVFFTLRQIEDYAVIPNVVGHAVRLHPVVILFAVAAGATLGGALGLFVAVPVTGALKVLGEYLYQKLDLR